MLGFDDGTGTFDIPRSGGTDIPRSGGRMDDEQDYGIEDDSPVGGDGSHVGGEPTSDAEVLAREMGASAASGPDIPEAARRS